MKIKDGFILKDVAGSKIVIATGDARLSFNGVMTFNSVGAEIFELLNGENTPDEIIKKIAENYGVSVDTVEKDFYALTEKLKKYNMLDE